MIKVWAVIEDTFREAFSKFTFITFFCLSTLLILFFLFALNLDIVDGALAAGRLFGQDLQWSGRSLGAQEVLMWIESGFVFMLFSVALFLSIFATADLIPHMLERGRIDLFLSKPLSRVQLLLSKYLGCLSIVFFNVLYLVVASWLVLSIKTGVWKFGFLGSGLIIVFAFAVYLALIVLIGVMTRSSAMAIMLSYGIVFLTQPLAYVHNIPPSFERVYPKLCFTLKTLYWILPKTWELGSMSRALVGDGRISAWQPVWTSAAFGGVMLALAGFYFVRKDY